MGREGERERERGRHLSDEVLLLRVSPLTSLRIAQKQMLNLFKVSCKKRYMAFMTV